MDTLSKLAKVAKKESDEGNGCMIELDIMVSIKVELGFISPYFIPN